MPKSRGRPHAKKPRRTSHGPPQARGHLPAEAHRDLSVIQAVNAAEARGDAHGALELMEHDLATRGDGGPGFWRYNRILTLWQMAMFTSLLPGWVTSRWVLAQAMHWMAPGRRRLSRKVLDTAIEVRGGPSTLVGVDELDAEVKVMDRDWVHRQLWLYEFGGLQHFLLRGASAELLVGADRIHEWARAPMGAYRLVSESARILTWHDLGGGQVVETPNLGSAALIAPGECAIGRLVPIESGVMFESAPLRLPDDLAQRVAGDPVDWIAPVAEACRHPDEGQRVSTGGRDFAACTDLPDLIRHLAAMHLADALGLDADVETHEELVDLEVALIRTAMHGQLPVGHDPAVWPMVATLLLRPAVFLEFALRLEAADLPALRHLADSLAGPAATVCLSLAGEVEADPGSRTA